MLTEFDIALRRKAGPDVLPADPGLLKSVSLSAPNLLQGNKTPTLAALLEGWISWSGPAGSQWQRILDFGFNAAVDASGNPVEDTYGNPGRSYMFLSPCSGNNTFRFAIKQGELAEAPVLDSPQLPVGQDVHFAVVYDTAAGAVRLYQNGQRVQTGPVTYPLSVVDDRNVYLGRSQWTDPYFAGQYDEFRVYDGTLSEDDVKKTFQAGPNALPDLTPAPSLSVSLAAGVLTFTWPASATGFNMESTAIVGTQAAWLAVTNQPTVVGNQNKVTLPLGSGTRFFRLKK